MCFITPIESGVSDSIPRSDRLENSSEMESEALEVVVRGERCKVIAKKSKATWKASGTFDGKLVEIHRATTASQAFEWWKNKAQMQQRD